MPTFAVRGGQQRSVGPRAGATRAQRWQLGLAFVGTVQLLVLLEVALRVAGGHAIVPTVALLLLALRRVGARRDRTDAGVVQRAGSGVIAAAGRSRWRCGQPHR